MPFLSLCCASSRNARLSEKAEADTRRARIVPILDPAQYNLADYLQPPPPPHRRSLGTDAEYSIRAPPPRYEDVYSTASLDGVPRAIIVTDEKDESQLTTVDESVAVQTNTENSEEQSRRTSSIQVQHTLPDGSDRSSIISIPSTQVTGLGSSYTGTTTLRGDPTGGRDRLSVDGSSGRNTLVDYNESRPPSYYAGSVHLQRRSRSPSPLPPPGERDEVWHHPVMREDWFDQVFGTRNER